MLEVLAGPPDGAALTRDWEAVWQKLRWLPVDLTVSERALSLLHALAQTTAGAHRRRPIDYLVAATAQSGEEVVLWHWDRDLTVICDHAGIAHEPEHERAKRNGIDGEPDGRPRG